MASAILSKRSTRSKIKCANCETLFTYEVGRKTKYCCRACYFEAKRAEPTPPKFLSGQCAHCKENVYGRYRKSNTDGTPNKNIYCNRQCMLDHRKAITLATRLRHCAECGKAVIRSKGYIKVYCNEICRIS